LAITRRARKVGNTYTCQYDNKGEDDD